MLRVQRYVKRSTVLPNNLDTILSGDLLAVGIWAHINDVSATEQMCYQKPAASLVSYHSFRC